MNDMYITHSANPYRVGAVLAITTYNAVSLSTNTKPSPLQVQSRTTYRVTRSVQTASGYDIYGVEVAL